MAVLLAVVALAVELLNGLVLALVLALAFGLSFWACTISMPTVFGGVPSLVANRTYSSC